MTPSEIADALDEVVATQEASRLAYKATELAAATIRELEAKLKVATEALEVIKVNTCEAITKHDADQALSRIKETK